MTALVDELVSSLSDDYRQLVLKVANGERTTPAKTQQALFGCGKSPQDFKADVELLQKRLAWIADIERSAVLRQEIDARHAAERKLTAEYEKALADFNRKWTPIVNALAREREAISVMIRSDQSGIAKNHLRRTASKSLHERMAATGRRQSELDAIVASPHQITRMIRDRGGRLLGRYEALEKQAAGMESFSPALLRCEDWEREQFCKIREQIAVAEQAAVEARRELVELEAEQRAITAEMLAPMNAALEGVSDPSPAAEPEQEALVEQGA